MSNLRQKSNIGDKLISNTIYLFLHSLTLSFFSFIFWMILGKTLKPAPLGIVSTSINLVILISGFSTLGIPNALRKLIPEIKGKKGLKSIYSLVKLSLKPLLISLFVVSLLLLIFSKQLSSFVKIPIYAFLISVFSIITVSVFEVFGSTLFGLQNMKKFFTTDFVQIILRVLLAGSLIFLVLNYFVQFENYLYLLPLIGFLLAYLFSLPLRFNSNYLTNDKSLSYKKLFFYASPALISSIASLLITRGEYIILTVIDGPQVTGIFTIAFTITSVIGALARMPGGGLLPILSVLSVKKKTKKKQGYLMGLVIRYSLFLIIPLSVLLVVFSKHAVLLYSTEEFLSSTQYFPILIPGAILWGVGAIFTSNLYNIGKPKTYRNILVLSSLLFIPLALILTTYFSALGLSFAYFITMLFQFLMSFIYLNRSVKLNLFIKDISKIFLSSIAILIILFIIRPFIHDIFVLGIILFPVSLIYLGILSLVKFYRIEDVRILRFFGERIPMVGKYILSIANFVESSL